ncbi:hypothetical protein [Hymenobacter jejuensis]|uniref:Glycosyltransferase RgtA/B/C/D-like domain-containing protein n=1 Tax=Hymenobacter jejuensis TaxID=2502781 RepID=A0A5B7ZYN5_9BACT|nr:hypothetical protein [Hymenobacter jejuensis]QDA59606.1 hypothetical protein FHG12_05550 [Hymenobacter jejuensis]
MLSPSFADQRLPAVPRWFWLALGVLHGAFFLYQVYNQYYIFPDTDRYLTAATNLRQAGELYALPLSEPRHPQEYTIRPPGYPLFLLALGGTSEGFPWVVLLVQNLLSFFNLSLIALCLRRHQPKPWNWGALLALIATYPAQFIYANVLMSELLLQTCVVVLWYCAWAYSERQKPHYLLGAALALTAAMLTKPVFYPFCGVFLFISAVVAWRMRRLVLLACGLLPLLAALLFQGWNYQRTGYFHFSSIAEINLLRYNVRGVLQQTEGVDSAERFVREVVMKANELPSFAAQQRYITAQSWSVLARYPLVAVRLHMQGTLNCFLDPGRFDWVHFLGLSSQSDAGLLAKLHAKGYAAIWQYARQMPVALLVAFLVIAIANGLRLVLLGRFLLSRSYAWPLRLVVAVLVFYVVFLTGPLGAARFLVPVFPLIALSATLGLLQRSIKSPAV